VLYDTRFAAAEPEASSHKRCTVSPGTVASAAANCLLEHVRHPLCHQKH
jgi:hypothetical protein